MDENNIPARFWQPLPGQMAECHLCPHRCTIAPGHTGRCRARRNCSGALVAETYGRITSLALDPIEKKPLLYFHPGSFILSAGSYGCNLRCAFCQNWSISQQTASFRLITPATLAELAVAAVARGNIGLALTYNEPLVGIEYALDCARLIRQAGLKTVLVTNGYVEPEPLEELLPWIDALNIDLKAWQDDFYHQTCGGSVEPVKKTIAAASAVCHVEVTTLLLPGLNDSDEDISQLADWLASLRPDIPLHLTRHHPDYQMAEPGPISRVRLAELAALARRRLRHVHVGNV